MISSSGCLLHAAQPVKQATHQKTMHAMSCARLTLDIEFIALQWKEAE